MSNLRESVRTVTIANGATTSEEIPTRGRMVTGFRIPAAFTGSTVTFLGSETSGGTFAAIYDSDGTQVSVAVAVDRFFGLSGSEADAVSAAPFIKLKSGSSELGARSIPVVLK